MDLCDFLSTSPIPVEFRWVLGEPDFQRASSMMTIDSFDGRLVQPSLIKNPDDQQFHGLLGGNLVNEENNDFVEKKIQEKPKEQKNGEIAIAMFDNEETDCDLDSMTAQIELKTADQWNWRIKKTLEKQNVGSIDYPTIKIQNRYVPTSIDICWAIFCFLFVGSFLCFLFYFFHEKITENVENVISFMARYFGWFYQMFKSLINPENGEVH